MESITIKVENNLSKEINKAMKKNYSTKTEFIREAIRDKLKELEREEIFRKLEKFKGSLKGKARMSEREARELANKQIAEKLGIKLD